MIGPDVFEKADPVLFWTRFKDTCEENSVQSMMTLTESAMTPCKDNQDILAFMQSKYKMWKDFQRFENGAYGSTGDTRAACLSQVWPILTYACNVWVLLLNDGPLTTLRCTANYMARVIAGLFRSTDTVSLYLEANMLHIMKTVDDKIMTGIERHRRRPDGDPLLVKALGTTPRVRASKVYHNKCWQQCADNIQERYGVYTRRRQIDKATGELKKATDYSSLTVTAATSDIAFLHRAPLDDPRHSILPDAAMDIRVRFYPQLIIPISDILTC